MSTSSCISLPQDLPIIDSEQAQMLLSVPGETSDSLLKELITLFVNENEPRLGDVARCCSEKDEEQLRQEVHFLGGSAANLGIQRMATLCKQSEVAIMRQEFDAYDSLPKVLQEEYESGIIELKKIARMN